MALRTEEVAVFMSPSTNCENACARMKEKDCPDSLFSVSGRYSS